VNHVHKFILYTTNDPFISVGYVPPDYFMDNLLGIFNGYIMNNKTR
jgi:hypothetical protein